MWKEMISSLSNNVRERASSPLLGSYTLCVLAINWKGLVVLFTSELKGESLVEEIISVTPDLMISIGYPLIAALAIATIYPALKAAISVLNTNWRMLEIKGEVRLEELKDRLNVKRDPIEYLIKRLEDPDYYDQFSYHDLKRLHEHLPNEEHLLIKKGSEKLRQAS